MLNDASCSVVGLNFDFVLLNLTKHSSYLIYNASLFFSSTVQRQYRRKFGLDEVVILGFGLVMMKFFMGCLVWFCLCVGVDC